MQNIIDHVYTHLSRLDSLLTSTEHRGPLGWGISLSSCLLLSAGQQPLLLLLLGLWPVLVGQFEQLCGCTREDRFSVTTTYSYTDMITDTTAMF